MISPRHIAIVPAKRNSKRCKDKNWREFQNGQSLAERRFMSALGSGLYHRVYLSIDFPEEKLVLRENPWNDYQLRASKGGARFRVRPKRLKDSVDVVLDILNWMGADDGEFYHLLQPTSPFVQKESLAAGKNTLVSQRCAVVAVNPAYKPSGALYAGLVGNLRKYRNFYEPFVVPLVLPWIECVDIDYEHDFQIARSLME